MCSIEIETASSVGIGFNHTPIIEDTISAVSISEMYRLVKYYDKDFTAVECVIILLWVSSPGRA